MNFSDLKLPRQILDALTEQGYTQPTPIQSKAIPPALEGRDVLGCAQTGTGKTCAFAVPILTRLGQTPIRSHPIRALILTPTRELAIQNQDCITAYGRYLPLRSTVIFGGVGQAPQAEALKRGTDILVATPGRLADLYQQGLIDLARLEIFVLDEADRMLDMGFIHDVKRILKWLPEKKQTLFFSATMPSEVQQLVDSLLHDPAKIAVDPVNSTADAIDQLLCRTDKSKKTKLLVWLLSQRQDPSVLVFTRTKHGANRVARDLEKAGISAAAIHGNKSQTARQAALAGFKDGSIRVLVATDIAARGLDIDGLSCVINYNLPDVPETYVHRIGRTGRAGQTGCAVSFCDASELDELKAIQKQLGREIPLLEQHPYPMEEMIIVTMKDKQGRPIHPEDAEARAAAKAQHRRGREKTAAPEAAPVSPKQQPNADQQQSAAPAKKRSRWNKKKKSPKPAEAAPISPETASVPAAAQQPKQEQSAPKQSQPKQPQPKKQKGEPKQQPQKLTTELPKKSSYAEEPMLDPKDDVGNYEDWMRHRASTRPQVRKPYSESCLDELLALPDFASELGYDTIGKSRPKKRNPLSDRGKVMDATARMFLKGQPTAVEEPAPKQQRSDRSDRSDRKSRRNDRPAPQPVKAASAPKQAPQPQKERKQQSGQSRKPQRMNLTAEQLRPVQKPKPVRSERPAPQQPAEQGKSLIRPYYLSDQKGKR